MAGKSPNQMEVPNRGGNIIGHEMTSFRLPEGFESGFRGIIQHLTSLNWQRIVRNQFDQIRNYPTIDPIPPSIWEPQILVVLSSKPTNSWGGTPLYFHQTWQENGGCAVAQQAALIRWQIGWRSSRSIRLWCPARWGMGEDGRGWERMGEDGRGWEDGGRWDENQWA